MTREEFIEKWGASMGHGFTDEELSTDLDSLFPPAEGAELDHQHDHLLDHPEGAEEFMKVTRPTMYAFLNDPEEACGMYEAVIETMEAFAKEFATLHAQRLAGKMVEEKLREELIAYDKYIGAKGWIDNYEDETAEPTVDEYLKSR